MKDSCLATSYPKRRVEQGVGRFPSEKILPLQKLGLDRTCCGAGRVPAPDKPWCYLKEHVSWDRIIPLSSVLRTLAPIPHLGCSQLDILER